MSDHPDHTYTYHLLIPHASEPRFLMEQGDGGWGLPHIQPELKWLARVRQNNEWVREKLGLNCITLYVAHVEDRRKDLGSVDALYVMQNRNPSWSPSGTLRWTGREEIATVSLDPPWLRAPIEAWFDEAEGRIEPPRRGAWNAPGWYDEASAWIRSQLEQHGITVTGEPEQFKHWTITSALKIPTDKGDYYFKAVPPVFAQEPGITQVLSTRYPEYVPGPLATRRQPGEGWMLMPDFQGQVLGGIGVEQLSQALRNLAKMQINSISRAEELRNAGCPDRTLERLSGQVEALLHDPVALEGLQPEEIEKLQALAPRFREMCARLAALGVPQTLLHGDFHGDNLLGKSDKVLIFDWTDGAISHPFFDLITALSNDWSAFTEEQRQAITQVYLAEWTAFDTPEHLAEAARLAWPLGGLHQAVSYLGILNTPSDATRWELVGAAAFFLKQALKAVEDMDGSAP